MQLRTSLSVVAGLGAAVALAPIGGHAVVPAAGADEAVITVRVGGDRVSGAITDTGPAEDAFSPLAGARLGLFAAPSDRAPIAQPWATCTSDAEGDCSFAVPDTAVGGANRDASFTVGQLAAPPGWSTIQTMGTVTPAGRRDTPYRFATGPELRAGSTYSSRADFMYSPATPANFHDATASSGVSLMERDDPAVVDRCGLDIALIFATSTSAGSAQSQLIHAANSFVDALTGTRSRAAAFSSAALSPGAASGPDRPALTSIATRSGAQAFKQQYASWGPSAGTSWDRGLFEAASSGRHFDVAVVITDSNADLYGDPEPVRHTTRATRFKELEYGIASANALKARGTRVIGVAVGAGIDVGPLSGPTAYPGSNALEADRFELADFTAASTALHSLATELCRGSVSVVTQLVPAGTIGGEDVSSTSSVGAGWGVSVTGSVSGLSGLPRTLTTSDDGTGTVNFPLDFAGGLTSADVTFLPAIRAGYHLVGQGGRIAACVDLATRRPLRVVNISALAFQVSARADFGLSCTIDVAQDPTAPGPTAPGPTAPGPTVPPVRIPLTVTGRASAVQDVDRDRKVSAGDALSYEYTVTNTSIVSVHNVMLVSPALGAVICPVTRLQPGASTRCVSHAPYVITARDEATGWVALRTRAVALDPRGGETSSHAATVRTTIGESVSLVGTS